MTTGRMRALSKVLIAPPPLLKAMDSKLSKNESIAEVIYEPPSWSCDPIPANISARFDASKDSEVVGTYMIGTKKISFFGRDRDTSDFVLANPSISRKHAAVIHDEQGGVYLVDLMSRHGTFAGKTKLAPHDPLLLHEGDVVQFGQSKRIYRLKGVDENGASAPPKRTWKMPKLSAKLPTVKSTRPKNRYTSDVTNLVNSVVRGSIEHSQVVKFCETVKNLQDDDKANQIVNLLTDKVNIKFDFKASTVQKNALYIILHLLKQNIAVNHVEKNVGTISQMSMSRHDSEARSISRKIMQILAKVTVDPETGLVSPRQNLDAKESVSNSTVVPPAAKLSPSSVNKTPSPKGYIQVVLPRKEPSSSSQISHQSTVALAKAVSSLSVSEVEEKSAGAISIQERSKALSNEGRKLFIESHSPSPRRNSSISSKDRASLKHRVSSSANSSTDSPSGIASRFGFISQTSDVKSPVATSAFGFMDSQMPSEEEKETPNLQAGNAIPYRFLSEEPSFDISTFEDVWAAAPELVEWETELSLNFNENSIEQLLEPHYIKCLASGRVGSVSKYYFFAEQAQNKTVFMAEVNWTASVCHLSVTFKWCEMDLLYDGGHMTFIDVFKDIFCPFMKKDTNVVDAPSFELSPNPYVNPASFEEIWARAPIIGQFSEHFDNLYTVEELEGLMEEDCISCLASGVVDSVTKYYFFAESKPIGALILLEISLDVEEEYIDVVARLDCTDRSVSSSQIVQSFSKWFMTFLEQKLVRTI